MSIRLLAAICIVLGSVANSLADPIINVSLQGGVRDDRLATVKIGDMYLLRDFGRFTNLSYDEQLSSIAALNTSDVSGMPWRNWHMANMNEVLELVPALGLWYNKLEPSYQTQDQSHREFTYKNVYYYARIDTWSEVWGQSDRHSVSARNYDYLQYNDGHQYQLDQWNNGLDSEWDNPGDDAAEFWLGAWVVADYVNSVPEPSSLLLFCTGALGIIGIRWKKRV